MENDFVSWLAGEMNIRGWSKSELARRADLVPSYISLVMNRQKRPGMGFCLKVAAALGVPHDRPLRLAGYLPPVSEERLSDFAYVAEMLASLPDGPIREDAIAAIRAIARDARQRALEREKVQQDSGPVPHSE